MGLHSCVFLRTFTMFSLLISYLLLMSPILGDDATDMKEIQKMKLEMDEMRAEMKSMISREVSKAMKEIPYVMVCSYQNEWHSQDATITFEEIISEFSVNGGGDMDLESGTFTAVTPGHYTITLNGQAELQAGQQVDVYIHKNGEYLLEGEWHSWAAEYTLDQGSRSVILHLSAGDVVHLGTGIFDGTIWRLVFCVSLTGYD